MYLSSLKGNPMASFCFLRRQIDRRDWGARQALARLVEEAFLTIPGICLTVPQASRVFGIGEDACARILADLQEKGVEARGGLYACWRREFIAQGFVQSDPCGSTRADRGE
jgi:hypothetical protein